MIDLNQWICSKDIAKWLADQGPLSVMEQIDCIYAAPHRTLQEKLDGLRELNDDCVEKELQNVISYLEDVIDRVCSDVPMQQYIYRTEIFYHGEREELQPEGTFRTAAKASGEIRKQIQQAAEQYGLERKDFYGVIHVLYENTPYEYRRREDLITNSDGEVILCQPDFLCSNTAVPDCIGMGEFRYMKIPYPSGTIIEIEGNPFIQPLKGVLVNAIEPDERGFADHTNGQCVIYPESWHIAQTNGIGITILSDDYIPFPGNPGLDLSYKQFIRRFDGELQEKDGWLGELSDLIKTDKSSLRIILSDRKPKKTIDPDRPRKQYVKDLAIRTKQGRDNAFSHKGNYHEYMANNVKNLRQG